MVLGEFTFEQDGVAHLQQLVPPVAWQRGEQLVLHHLLGDGGGAARRTFVDIGNHLSTNRAKVDASVLTERAIFDGQQRIDDVLRNLRDEGLLAVLGLEDPDLSSLRVEHHTAFGQTGETTHFVERDGRLVVGVQHAPHTGCHASNQGRHQQG